MGARQKDIVVVFVAKVFTAALLLLFVLSSVAEAGCGDIKLQMTGGDGFVVEFGPDGKLYNAYHHHRATMNCNDPLTGDLCPGYPPEGIHVDDHLKALNWTHMTGEKDIELRYTKGVGVFKGPQFLCLDPSRPECFEFFMPMSFMMSTNKWYFGVVCFDISTKLPCASHPVTILNPVAVYGPKVVDGGAFNLIRIENKFYSLDTGYNILCYDIEKHERCDGFPRQLVINGFPPADPAKGHVDFSHSIQYLVYNGKPRFYIGVAYGVFRMKGLFKIRVSCVEFDTFDVCPEFDNRAFALSKGKTYHIGELFFEYDRNGEPISVCSFPFRAAKEGMCRSLADPNQVTGEDLINDMLKITKHDAGIFSMFRHENRIYWASTDFEGIYCYDFTTRAGCPNFPTVESTISGDVNARDYGITLDPTGECFFSLGHENVIYTFDSQGNVPCRNATLPLTRSDVFVLPDFVESTLDVLQNDSFFAPSTLKIVTPPSSPHVAVVDGKIVFTPTQQIDRFEYQVCSPGYAPATSVASVTVKVCRNQEDCLEDVDQISIKADKEKEHSLHQHRDL